MKGGRILQERVRVLDHCKGVPWAHFWELWESQETIKTVVSNDYSKSQSYSWMNHALWKFIDLNCKMSRSTYNIHSIKQGVFTVQHPSDVFHLIKDCSGKRFHVVCAVCTGTHMHSYVHVCMQMQGVVKAIYSLGVVHLVFWDRVSHWPRTHHII